MRHSFRSTLLTTFFLSLALVPGASRAEKPAEETRQGANKPKASSGEKPDGDRPEPQDPKAETAKPKPTAPVSKEESASAKTDSPEKSDTLHVVKVEPFVQKVKVSGTVESTKESPVDMNLKRWADMTVIRVVPHGNAVKAGDVLIELETKDLKKKIDELRIGMPIKELELAAAVLELENAEKSTPLDLAKATREKTQAEQDLVHFEDESRPMRERGAKEDVKEVANALAYAEEELNQLKKMYEKDDLTEETEEIILKRAENTVSRYQWMLEQTGAKADRTLNTLIPREHESLKSNLEMVRINWRAGEKSMREGLEKKRHETAAKQREIEELRKSLVEYDEDLAAMKVTAPHDGIVYYGMSQRGKWTTAAVVDRKLIPGGKLAMREIVMTVVDPAQVQIRLSLTEDQLKDLAVGQSGSFHLKWKPDLKFNSKVKSILYVPFPDKTFDAILEVTNPAGEMVLMPGMTADAEITAYEKKDALVIPRSAVKKEGDKETVAGKDGKPVAVKAGRIQGDKIEILEGLKPGDTIRLPAARPEPAKEAAAEKIPAKEAKSEPDKKDE